MSKHRARRSPRRRALIPAVSVAVAGTSFVLLTGAGSAEPTRTAAEPAAAAASPEPGPTVPATPDPAPLAAPVKATRAVQPAYVAKPLGDAGASSLDDVPDPALAAYLAAERVMRDVTRGEPCRLSWSVLAAIGRHATDHGRTYGSDLDADGTATPAIYGAPSQASRVVPRLADTDAGLLDGTARLDRPAGPMQFVPSAWTLVGVDADGDGQRDPQDVDDSALAAAVLLCSAADLTTEPGIRKALARYNPAPGYADAVLPLSEHYLAEYEALLAAPPDAPVVVLVGPSTPAGTDSSEPTRHGPSPTQDQSEDSDSDLGTGPKHAGPRSAPPQSPSATPPHTSPATPSATPSPSLTPSPSPRSAAPGTV
jgi:membrane-bound lytic murein transglycosylase B